MLGDDVGPRPYRSEIYPERFPVGAAVPHLGRDAKENPVATLRFYRVRNEYRRMGLFPKMIMTLTEALAREFLGVRIEAAPTR